MIPRGRAAVDSSDPFNVAVDVKEADPATEEELSKLSLLPAGLSHDIFLKPDFTANEFLLSRRHTPLEELRTELRAYLSDLRQQLVGVINRDYEDFIGLSIGLRGTDKRLERMRRPIETVKQQVEVGQSLDHFKPFSNAHGCSLQDPNWSRSNLR